MKNLTKKLITIALITAPVLGFAQYNSANQLNTPNVGVQGLNDINQIIVGLVNWVTGLFFVAAVLFLFYAAYLYLSAAGYPEKLKKAKDQLIYSVIAIAVALLAGSVRFIVQSILQRQF